MSLRNIANDFSLKVVAGSYEDAFEMLSGEAREIWSASSLKESYLDMIEYFEGEAAQVLTEFDDEFGMTPLEDGTLLYVPVNTESGLSEAISGVIDASGGITEVEFGRP